MNWKNFELKYDKREQWAFEKMSYFLFCSEMEYHNGIFRYFNQTGIETEPIEKDGKYFGFQAKYSKEKQAIIDSITKAKEKNSRLTNIYLYIGKEFKESPVKNKKKPKYQIEIEEVAKQIDIEIEWRVQSHFEYQLSKPQNKWIKDIFFDSNGLDPDFFENQIEKEIKNLGPRFNKRLNFNLPIAQVFDNLAHNDIYNKRIINTIDNWLTEKSYRKLNDNKHLSELETELKLLKKELTNWVKNFKYKIDRPIPLNDFIEKLKLFNDETIKKRSEIYELKEWRERSNKFDKESDRLWEIESNNNDFLEKLDDLKINLSNNPTLIIQGEAGSGKSHLLGDIASRRKSQYLPTILLLGTTFNSSFTIERNILNRLGLNCSFSEFLINLNFIGKSINSRVLILIDAINEGGGADLWKDQIAGFVSEVNKYPAIGLVLTIRSTYFDDIISTSFKSDEKNTFITHVGFKGNEYEALKLFCEYYELDLPNFPILNPEFSNPLFLHLICEATKNKQEKCFPKGFNDINKTYSLYKNTLNQKFDKKRHEYKNRKIVSRAIEKFASSLQNNKYGHLESDEVFSLFDREFPQFPHLVTDLIEECVFIKMRYEYGETPKDIISFSYQKLGDFFIAEELLKPYKTKEDIENAFKCDTKFEWLRNEYEWSFRGVAEVLSILLPEKYDTELFEFIDYFLTKNPDDKKDDEWKKFNTLETFTRLLLNSLKWRDIGYINDEKITTWLEKNGRISDEEWLYALTELSSISKHPFNSDRLHRILKRYSMKERDGFWQKYLLYYSSNSDDKIAHPLRRLIDWAWTPDISINTDFETTRLVAQTLAWVLSSTDIALRDQTTKALVNLLEQQPEVLVIILKSFQDVDDLYILERLYAVTYGCILRTEKDKSIKTIGDYVYNTIFKDKNPPTHILLRDYARNTIEYAIYKKVGIELDQDRIRPPYNSSMPTLPESKDEVKRYKLDYEDPNYKKNNDAQQNAIYYSVISGIADFGRYIVDSAIKRFASYSFREDETYNIFLRSLKKEPRELLKILYDCTDIKKLNKKTTYQKGLGLSYSKNQLNYSEMLGELESICLNKLKELLNPEQFSHIENTIIPYFEKKASNENYNNPNIRYWIVKRVFELGYDKEIHGDYDSGVSNFYYRSENKVERIGKKYQWIAFYEIMAILTDNYKIKDNWISDSKYQFYKGAWQLYLRNIDPAYITKSSNREIDNFIKTNKEWWEDGDYTEWNHPDSEWVKTVEDLIDPKLVIEKKDTKNEEWIHLQCFVKWEEPKKVGIDKYDGRLKQFYYIIQGLLVKKSSKNRIVNYLKEKNFFGRWLPENNDDHSRLINREKFWSPAYKDTYKDDRKFWETIQETNLKVIVTTTSANGGMENDKSGANQSYNIPCKYIFEKMSLQYSPTDGNLENESGEIVVRNSNPSGVLVRKKEFVEFLKENNLEIIWTVLGEKFSFDSRRDADSYFKVPCGVYYLDGKQVKGELKMYDRD